MELLTPLMRVTEQLVGRAESRRLFHQTLLGDVGRVLLQIGSWLRMTDAKMDAWHSTAVGGNTTWHREHCRYIDATAVPPVAITALRKSSWRSPTRI